MAWIRLRDHPAHVVNLELFVAVEAVAMDGNDHGVWQVFALPPPGSEVRRTAIFEGTRSECETVVDEIARAVWALEVVMPESQVAPS
jgi:hypothetical protein